MSPLYLTNKVSFFYVLPLDELISIISVMSCIYSILEILDMLVLRKSNGSDAEQFAEKYGIFPAQGWGFIWLIISLIFLVGAVLAGLAAFKDDGAGNGAGTGK